MDTFLSKPGRMGSLHAGLFCLCIVFAGAFSSPYAKEAVTTDPFDEICCITAETPPWADGLLLRAGGWETECHRKD